MAGSLWSMIGNGFNTVASTAQQIYTDKLQAQSVANQYKLQQATQQYQAATAATSAATAAANAAQQQTIGNIMTWGSVLLGLGLVVYLASRFMRGRR